MTSLPSITRLPCNETLTVTLSSPSGAEISDGQATGTITNSEPQTLTAAFKSMPDSHDGSTAFIFQVEFSEDIAASYATMRDDSFTVTDGDVTTARRVNGRNDLWEITVDPDSDNDVAISLPGNRACTTTGAVCTRGEDPRQLTNSPSATVTGPDDVPTTNTPATGAPTISGTPQVEQNLTVDTASIADEDGLTNVSYDYQWLAAGSDIDGATGSSYTLTSSEEGDTIQVRVTFTDDADNSETLTSVATGAVAAKPVPLTATFSNVPSAHDGSTNFTFDLAFSENIKAGFARIRDDAFNVVDGDIIAAQRKVQGSNQTWTITVEPDGNGAVTITLPATTDCNAASAICTYDDRKLSHTNVATITGPQ